MPLLLFLSERSVTMAKGKGGNVVNAVWELAEPIAKELGLEIWDVRFLKEGTDWILRIFIDKEEGIDIEDCVNMTHAIDKPLDDLDPIDQSYSLEVSSPGVERDLTRPEHFEKYKGANIKVKLIRPVDGQREFNGVLEDSDGKLFVLRLENGSAMEIDKKETAYIKLDDFDM